MKKYIFRKGAPGYYDWIHQIPKIKMDAFCFYHLSKEDQKLYKKDYKETLINYKKILKFESKLTPIETKLYNEQVHHHYPGRELWKATRDNKLIQYWESLYFPEGFVPVKMFTKEEIGAAIKKARKLDGRSRNEVAAIIGVSQNTLKMYEDGKRMLRVDILFALLQLYEIDFGF